MENLLKSKTEYRNYAQKIRRTLDILQISSDICKQLRNFEFYEKAKVVAGFYPFDKEIDLRQLYSDTSKKFLLPRVIDEENIAFYPFDETTLLEKNRWGILEPALSEQPAATPTPDLILIPALMVDKRGYRLGYGKGYYDRYLSKLTAQCLKIAPVPEELFVDALPYDEFDVPVDIVVTENQVYDPRLASSF